MHEFNSTTFFHFDTVCSLAADVDESALAGAARLCDRFELLYSRFDPKSTLYQVNAAQGQWTPVEPELADAVAAAISYCEETDGLFDITMGSVCALWNFKQGVVPDEEDIERARAHVDWRGVELDGGRMRLVDPQATVDLGGVAKGIIADALAAHLINGGATSGYVNLGGNVLVIGSKPDGQPWNVGLRSPAHTSDAQGAESFATVAVRGKSVVTSGIFERAFAYEGHLLHHILDPRTGVPAVTDVVSATVIAERSTDADGLTTALVIAGSQRALAFAEKRPGIEAILLTADGRILRTSGVEGEGTTFHVS